MPASPSHVPGAAHALLIQRPSLPTALPQALWEEGANCFFVAPEQEGSGVLWYRDSFWYR